MALPTDWRADPLVRIEAEALPLLAEVPIHLCRLALGQACGASDMSARITRFAAWLESGFQDVLYPTGFTLDDPAKRACRDAAAAWRALQPLDPPDAALERFEGSCVPLLCTALDEVRRVFIGGVLQRQAAHAALSEAALRELSGLTQSIQLVAINASIEAAHFGPAGRSFALIADEIRQLATASGAVIAQQRP